MKDMLDYFYDQEYDERAEDKTISINFGPTVGTIVHDIPTNLEKTFLDNYWFCTGLF